MIKFFTLLSLSLSHLSFAQESIRADHIRISWLAPKTLGSESEKIGIYFETDPDWHVYWRNPGDSGAAPKFDITLNGFKEGFGDIEWPYPHRIPVEHLTNFGYDKEVAYLFQIQPQSPTTNITVDLEWLVCKVECIPGFGQLKLSRKVDLSKPSEWSLDRKEILNRFSKKIPANGDLSKISITGKVIDKNSFQLLLKSADHLSDAPDIFPLDREYLTPKSPSVVRAENDFVYTFNVQPAGKVPKSFQFVVVSKGEAWSFSDVVPEIAQSSTSISSLLFLFFSAFLGGLILNLMPCVLPVLSIKILSLVKTAEGRHLREAFMYGLGVVVTFVGLGLIFVLLRQFGSAVGWGFQLQSPVIIFSLILLFWLMALNFLGVYEVGTGLMNQSGRYKSSNSFITGVLAVFVAAPCTGPFMGTVLGASTTLPTISALGLFFFLGLGLATPFVVLAMSPALMRYIPKPGLWMERLKQFFAFPLFATVLWLLWVLSVQTGTLGWVSVSSTLLLLAFSFWLYKSNNKFLKKLSWLIALISILYSFAAVRTAQDSAQSAASAWTAYDETAITSARTKGQAVFIDFTAAWCITCQVNKKLVLDTAPATKLFSDNKVLTVRADWTKYDPVITNALTRFGRNSVPVYVFYPADGSEAKVLPQILSMVIIEDLFSTKGENTK